MKQAKSFFVFVNGDAFGLCLNEVQWSTANNAATFNLFLGWNKMEFSSYNQNQGTEVTIDIPVGNVLSIDGDGPVM